METKLYCPYCHKNLPDQQTPCCGEVGHGVELSVIMTHAYDNAVNQCREQMHELARLKAVNAQLIAALDPFARIAMIMEPLTGRDDVPLRDCVPGTWPTLGDCRKARAALSRAQEE